MRNWFKKSFLLTLLSVLLFLTGCGSVIRDDTRQIPDDMTLAAAYIKDVPVPLGIMDDRTPLGSLRLIDDWVPLAGGFTDDRTPLSTMRLIDDWVPLSGKLVDDRTPLSGRLVDDRTPLASSIPFSVHFIDVGQGDSALIVMGEETILIDAGDAMYTNKIVSYLNTLGISVISHLIGTHHHADHIGGMAGLIDHFIIGDIYMPEVPHTTKTYENLLDTIIRHGYTASCPKPGESFMLGGATVTFLAPHKPYASDLNNSSIVVRIDYNGFSFLFTGDAEVASENDMMKSGLPLSADVLKVAHHASRSSTSESFLRAVAPDIAVISLGKDNSYSHPHDEVIRRLTNNKTDIYRTDKHGDIIMYIDDYNGHLIVLTSRNELSPAPVVNIVYIGNVNSKKFHADTCRTLPSESNSVYFESRADAVSKGYDPCGNCKP